MDPIQLTELALQVDQDIKRLEGFQEIKKKQEVLFQYADWDNVATSGLTFTRSNQFLGYIDTGPRPTIDVDEDFGSVTYTYEYEPTSNLITINLNQND